MGVIASAGEEIVGVADCRLCFGDVLHRWRYRLVADQEASSTPGTVVPADGDRWRAYWLDDGPEENALLQR